MNQRNKLLAIAGSNRILLALDGLTPAEAHERASEFIQHAIGVKATDLIDQGGAHVLDDFPFAIKFLDPKINDISNTVRNRLRHYHTADIVTVHASMSTDALRTAAAVGDELGITIVGVTVLTNINTDECQSIFGAPASAAVEQFVVRVRDAGLLGIVCSPHEASVVRTLWPEALIITPGVRSIYAISNDQERTTTPAQAIQNGADFVVIGRQVLALPTTDTRQAEIVRIQKEITTVL